MKRPLGELLVEAGAITEDALRAGLAHQRNRGVSLGQALVELGHADEVAVARVVARQHGLPFVDLRKGRAADEALSKVPPEVARAHGVLPLLVREGKLVVAVDDPLKRIVAEELEFLLGLPVACALAAPGALRAALERHLGDAAARPAPAPGGHEDPEAPVVRLVTRTLEEAVRARASDVHVETRASGVAVRFRVDGVLRETARHPGHLAAPLVSRIKILGKMDIAERRKPQDGRIDLEVDGRQIDVRASILPGNHGESIVLRLLDRSAAVLDLAQLGFAADDRAWFERVIARPGGIVLVTGPTGSGKTTTLYAALSALNRSDVKIITAEDPVEYHVPGVNQVQVHGRIGLTFARILRAMLRCAPNVILVGEIRDAETAEVAIQASLTGHLVFSTLHTNDAPSALLRLVDMGVKPFLVTTSVQGVVAQRLVRRLCRECREAYAPVEAELARLAVPPEARGRSFWRPRGCSACEGTGYRGRMGLFELFELDAGLREAVFRGAGAGAVRAAALGAGLLRPLLADGARKVLAGETSVAEVLRVARSDSEEVSA